MTEKKKDSYEDAPTTSGVWVAVAIAGIIVLIVAVEMLRSRG